MKNMNIYGGILFGWLLFTLILAFFIQSRDYYNGENPIIRPRLERIEAFQSGRGSAVGTNEPLVGGDAALSSPREPYALLKDWFPTTDRPIYPDAQRCYGSDFQTRLERTGNFRQLTNNYKRGSPDSCLGTREEMNMGIYKPVILDAA
jgi:hypothetical protein